jgi:hypothetical protein
MSSALLTSHFEMIWSGADGYALCTVPDDDTPTLLLFHKEKTVVSH